MVLSRCFLILFFIQIQLSQVDGSQPLVSDVGSLVTLTVITIFRNHSSSVKQIFDCTVTDNGLMQFSLNLAHSDSIRINLQVLLH